MTRKEDLQNQLRELEAKLQPLIDKEDRTEADIKAMTDICDQMETNTAEIVAEERAEKAIEDLRKPVGDPPDQGQPGEKQGFNSFGEYLQAVAAASMPRGGELAGIPCGIYDKRLTWTDPELRAPTGLSEGIPSLGGFLVQKDFTNDLFTKAHQASIVYDKTRKITISGRSNGLKIPGIDEVSRADGSRSGGIRGYWLEEAGAKTASKPKFMLVELNLHKLIGLCYATDELLEDTTALESIVRQGFIDEFAFKLDDAVIRGTGVGQPLGILNAPALVSVTAGSSSGTIVASDIVDVYRRMFPASLARAEWFANINCLDYLVGMNTTTLTTATGGADGSPVWLPANQLAGIPHQTLMGKPIRYIEQASSIGTAGDMILADLSQYVTITKGGMQSASSIHVQFTNDETVFRFVFRVDGQPLWQSPLTPYKGSDTLSPFVTIATRT